MFSKVLFITLFFLSAVYGETIHKHNHTDWREISKKIDMITRSVREIFVDIHSSVLRENEHAVALIV